jgi:3-oxoacyl-[acyl-carrier-protein] synthase II
MGLITPLGCQVERVWERLIAGESGITPVERFDVEGFSSKVAGQVLEGPDFFSQWVSSKEQKKMDRFILLGVSAAAIALQDARWPEDSFDAERTGVLIGSGIGGLPEIEQSSITLYTRGPGRVSPFFVPSSLINLLSGHISVRYGLTGPSLAVVSACSSGAHAIGEAAEMIRRGIVDVMVAGGAEAAICPMGLAGFSAMKALSTHFNEDPTRASRPFDRDRDGFVIGEGAGIVVLERLEHALERGAPIYGELLGYGLSSDAHHIVAPHEHGDGAYRCMKMALKNAGLTPEAIGYVNAHGTSTPAGDLAELRAIERLFSSHERKKDPLRVSSTKSSMGHLLGAAGSVEAILCLLAHMHGKIPATLNLDHPEETHLDLVPYVAQDVGDLQASLSNSFGFGGTNATLIFGAAPKNHHD